MASMSEMNRSAKSIWLKSVDGYTRKAKCDSCEVVKDFRQFWDNSKRKPSLTCSGCLQRAARRLPSSPFNS